jgi:phage terminase large subunit
MTLPEKEIRWKPTLPQSKILQSNKKFNLFLGGIGSGKSAVGCMYFILQAIQQPGSLGAVITTTYPMMRDVIWREMWRWIPEEIVTRFDESKHELAFNNGSVILFRSADNSRHIERLRGLTLAYWYADEITLLPKLIWDIMIGRLRQPGMKYSVLLTGTPKMNWVYDTFIDPQKRVQSDEFFILKEIPTFSNIYLPPEYLKSLTEQYTGQFFEQEVLGKFISFEGLIYDLKPEWIIDQPKHKFARIIYGVDFGFTNPSAIVVIGEYQNKYYIVDEFYQRKVTDDELIDVLKSKQAYWGIGKVYCDPSAPASIEKMKREGVQAEKANNDVIGGIRQVRTLMDSGRLLVSNTCQNCINEFRSYIWDDNQKKEMPVKLQDHLQDSIRYVLIELSKPIIKPTMMPDFGSSVGIAGY